jgi:hypothetical protein
VACVACVRDEPWKIPLGVVSVVTLTSFILGCVATDMARNNANAINGLSLHPKSVCAFGDELFGETLHSKSAASAQAPSERSKRPSPPRPSPPCTYPPISLPILLSRLARSPAEGHNGGASYQIIGANGAALTWNEALADAKSRCYQGHPGYLAIIGSQEENDFLHSLIQAAPGYVAGNDAWIGATDTGTEGSFAWIGPQKMAEGVLFWKDDAPVDGSFAYWADNEPNEVRPATSPARL